MDFPTTCPQCAHVNRAEFADSSVHDLRCARCGARYCVLVRKQKFEVLFDLGTRALMDGYAREAVASFAAALERFFEFYVRAFALEQAAGRAGQSQGAGVPENVIDQLVIWEEERHRASFEPAVMVGGFETVGSFRECAAFASREAALEWSDEAKLQLLVKRGAVDALKAFMRSKGLGGSARA